MQDEKKQKKLKVTQLKMLKEALARFEDLRDEKEIWRGIEAMLLIATTRQEQAKQEDFSDLETGSEGDSD